MSWQWSVFVMGCVALYCVVFIASVAWAINKHERDNQ